MGRATRVVDRLMARALWASAGLMTLVVVGIIFFVGRQGFLTFADVSPLTFFFGAEWSPGAQSPSFGALPFFLGSFLVTVLALVVGGSVGLAGAIFMAKIAPPAVRLVMRQGVDLFVGIPSVVYGYIGMTALVPLVRGAFGGSGFSPLVAGVILGIMILPTVLSVADDAIRALPQSLEEGSLALGATRWETIWKVLLPAARPGVLAGVILAFARAFGEATAVQMVIGNAPLLPTSLLEPAATLTSQIMLEMGNTPYGSTWNNALFMMAFGLLVNSMFMILLVRWVGGRRAVR